MNTRKLQDLEWFGPPERNTLLHCELYSVSECLSLCKTEDVVNLACNVVCLPFYSPREAHTRLLSPDMWAQGHNGRNTWSN
jgi:hypothetical protein